MILEFITNSAEETIEVAKSFAKSLSKNEKILLYGELGSGKTTFIKGIAIGLNIKDSNEVVSPSFVLIKEYKINNKIIFHIDLYRIKEDDDFIKNELDYLLRSDRLVIIEWADRMKDIDFSHYKINLEYINENSRKITIKREFL